VTEKEKPKPVAVKPEAAKPVAPMKNAAKTKVVSPDGERIAKVLSRAGISSRREAERLIELGEVKVNGKTITSPALNVTPKDTITVRGELVGAPEPARLWLYYKPEGLVTSDSDEKGRDTIYDHLPEGMPRVMSVGRLDLNSEGLLLLTNDGELKRKLELPSTGWLRKYRVRVKGNPTDPELEPLRTGITVDGERFQPMHVMLDRHQGANAWLTIGLREGKNREIRRAIDAIGLIVNRLIRISYGPFRLPEDMHPGEVDEIRQKVMHEQLGTNPHEEEKPKRGLRKPDSRLSPAPTTRGSAEGTRRVVVKPRLKPGEGLQQLSDAWQTATDGKSKPVRAKPAEKVGDAAGAKPVRKSSGKSSTPDWARPARPKVEGKLTRAPRKPAPKRPRGE
jgi:23S rRNA pseudouridine2605 synthase